MSSPRPSVDLIFQRRGSAASAVSVTIETTTTSSPVVNTSPSPPLHTASVEPFAGTRARSPPPSSFAVPCLLLLPRLAVDEDIDVDAPPTDQYVFPPPPPYSFPPSPGVPSAPTTSSFFPLPFSSLTPVTASFPPLPASFSLPSIAPTAGYTSTRLSLPPPSYAETPRTKAERCFWWGFLLPLLWIGGAFRLVRSERPIGFREREKARKGREVDLEAALGETAPIEARGEAVEGELEESLRLWREEERLWARRCLSCLGAFMALGGVMGVVMSSLLGKV